MSKSSLFPRLFKQINNQARLPLTTSTRPTPFLNTTWSSSITRVPVMRQVHSSPKEYNGLQSAAYHFKRQRHMPYFLEYLMWVVFGSEALHLIWLKMDYKEYKEKIQHKTKLLEEIIRRLENGEQMTDSLREEIRMVLMKHKNSEDQEDIDDEYLNHLIASSENTQQTSAEDTSEKTKKPLEESKWVVDVEQTEGTEEKKKKKQAFFL